MYLILVQIIILNNKINRFQQTNICQNYFVFLGGIWGQDETDKETGSHGIEEESSETAPKEDEKKKDDSMENQ